MTSRAGKSKDALEMSPEAERDMARHQARGQRERMAGFLWLLLIVAIVVGRFTPIKPVQDFFGSFRWLSEQALRLAEGLFESYGYLTVFLAPLLENTVFLGAILPGALVMLLAGLGAHDGLIQLWPAIPLGILGAWIGDTISYAIGRFGWQRLGPESRLVRWSERMREPLLEQSAWLVLLYHFAGYSRVVGPAASGFIRMPFGRWVLLDYAGAAAWVVVYVMGGYLLGVFGLSLEATDRNVRVFEALLFVLAILAVAVVLNRGLKRRPQEETLPGAAGVPSTDDRRLGEATGVAQLDRQETAERSN